MDARFILRLILIIADRILANVVKSSFLLTKKCADIWMMIPLLHKERLTKENVCLVLAFCFFKACLHSCFIGFFFVWMISDILSQYATHILMILSFSLMMTLLLKFQSEFTRQSIRMRIQLWLFISMEAASHLEVLVSKCTFDAGVYKKFAKL